MCCDVSQISRKAVFYFENNHPDVIIFVSGITVCGARVGSKAVSPCLKKPRVSNRVVTELCPADIKPDTHSIKHTL